MKVQKLTVLSMLTALYVVFTIMTPVKLINFKFTLEAFPILVAGMLLDKWDGLIVGLLGSAIYQVLFSSYGITPTTPLWILPHAASGLLVGLWAHKVKDLDYRNIFIIAVVSAFVVTTLNTLALYVDSRLYGYYSSKLVFGTLVIKYGTGAVLAVVFALILVKLIPQLRKILKG